MIYQKACLRSLSRKAAALCRLGSGASGSQIAQTQCAPTGGSADAGAVGQCIVGSGDANDYYASCVSGTAFSPITACNAGNGVT